MPDDFESWRKELIATGRIVQDHDDSLSEDEWRSRFDRYSFETFGPRPAWRLKLPNFSPLSALPP